MRTPSDEPSGLLAFRRRALVVAATALAVGMGALAVILPLTVPSITGRDVALLVVVASIHGVAARTVGRRWEPGGVVCAAYLLVIELAVGAGVATSVGPESDAFWFLLAPLGLSALTMALWPHVALVAAGAAIVAASSALGPGLALDRVVPRTVAAVLFSAVLFGLARRLEQALLEAEEARSLLQDQYLEVQAANEKLAELDLAKDEFVSTVAHELRTPLSTVIATSETLVSRWERLGDKERRGLVETVRRSSQGVDSIVATLLDLARIERGGFVPQLAPVDLRTSAQESLGRLASVLHAHDVHVMVQQGVAAHADGRLLDRVFDNLLLNAARHTPAGTRVEVRAGREADGIRVEVADDGPGIDPEELGRLGERFFRAGTGPGKVEGVGIGLALVTDVLAALGSRLEVASSPGQGATFSFLLAGSQGEAPHA